MGIDVNDIKVVMNSGLQYLMKTCHQWAKDHPVVSGVLLFFYLLYIFLPSVFSILFYSFPLVICTAILLGGSRTSPDKHPKSTKKEDDKSSSHNGTSVHRRLHRPHLQSQLSRRTFGKDKSRHFSRDKDRIEGLHRKDDPTMHINSILEEEIMPMKISPSLDVTTGEKPTLENDNDKELGVDPPEMGSAELSMYAALPLTNDKTVSENSISGKTQSFSRAASSSSDLESEDDEPQEVTNKVLEWTEDDQRNLMDLGSSEIERNHRLESLMEKRKGKKILSMQPRRNHLDYLGNYYPRDHHLERVGSVMLARPRDTRNPFDLPYEPQEERPVLRGGSFEEEFFEDLLKDLHSHDGFSFAGTHFFGQVKEDPITKSVPCFIPKPPPPNKLGFSRFRRESDVEDNVNEEMPRKVKKEEDSGIKEYKEENPPQVTRDEVRLTQDHASENKGHHDGAESSTSSSSSSSRRSRKSSSHSSPESRRNARKNDASRSSERKGLNCLTAPRNKGWYTGKGKATSVSSSTLLHVSSPTVATCSKMEERSYYSSRPRHHKPSTSIASDMHVEVSEAGSPSLEVLDLNSPTDRESLLYDADVDRDANSGDEDFWGTSPHPMRLGSFGPRSRLPDIIEDNNSRGVDTGIGHNAHDPPVMSRKLVGEAEQAAEGGTTATLSPMPEGNGKEVGDQNSTNGEIIESKTSVSSSASECLDSQKEGKSQHLAEYLARLHPRETDSNTLEVSAEEINVQEESNGIFEMDEDKEESKETQKIGGQSHARDRSEVSKESSSASNECIEDLAPFITDQTGHWKRSEDDESTVLQKHVREANPREVIADSFSTTSLDDIGDQSRPEEEHHARPGKEMKTTSGNHTEVEVKAESPNMTDEESTSLRKATGEANHVEHDTDVLDVDYEIIKESKAGSPKTKDTLESMRAKKCHMELPSSIEVNQKEVIADSFSTTSLDDIGDQSRPGEEEHHAKSEKEMKMTSGNHTEVEVKAESSNMIHEESTSLRKATGEANHVDHDTKALDVDHEISKESKAGLPKTEDIPESVMTKGSHMELPSLTDVNPKEIIAGSSTTTSLNNIVDQSRPQEEHLAKSDREMKTTSENHMEVEVKAESPNMIHGESTSSGKGTGEANDVDQDTNALDVDHEASKESKPGSPKTEDAPARTKKS
ncbi:hypothetical protein Cgig2_005000 [Carnegiea gigantea]|uniref:Uncharacterized protein n=1 Tax=Carnegiea gigantea TaxID=171969 RepID=A0A9Q1L196_9CARY|nr:hypothetical protein Cgig2_005000 [Carnegiea gigantea]